MSVSELPRGIMLRSEDFNSRCFRRHKTRTVVVHNGHICRIDRTIAINICGKIPSFIIRRIVIQRSYISRINTAVLIYIRAQDGIISATVILLVITISLSCTGSKVIDDRTACK